MHGHVSSEKPIVSPPVGLISRWSLSAKSKKDGAEIDDTNVSASHYYKALLSGALERAAVLKSPRTEKNREH